MAPSMAKQTNARRKPAPLANFAGAIAIVAHEPCSGEKSLFLNRSIYFRMI